MATTFTLEPELVERLERAARDRGQEVEVTLHEVLKAGLERTEASSPPKRFRVEPHDFGFLPGIDLDRMNKLADELETEELVRNVKP
jgi:hypothetical protein